MTDKQLEDACRIIDRLIYMFCLDDTPVSSAELSALWWLHRHASTDMFISSSTRVKMGQLK